MPADRERSGAGSAEDATGLFMTSVYLILLAFFVVLTSVSVLEPAKSRQVLASVSEAFGAGPGTSPGDIWPGSALEGIDEATELHRRLGELFETSIELAKIEYVDPARLMQIAVPASAIFVEDRVRPQALPLLDEVARILGARTGTRMHRLEFVAGAEPDSRSALEVRRAGALARALLSAGAPSGAIVIGLGPADPGEARFLFHAVDPAEGRVVFARDDL